MKGQARSNWKIAFMFVLVPLSLMVIVFLPNWIYVFIPIEFVMALWLILFMILVWKLTDQQ